MPNRPSAKKIKELLAPLLTSERRRRIKYVLERRTKYVTLVLDDLYHQHNMSAVVRSCEAFGIQDVHVIELENRFVPTHGVSMGAQQWISIYRYSSISDCINVLKENGYRILAADPPEKALETKQKTSVSIDDLDIKEGRVAIVLGKELDGLDPRLRNQCDSVVYIPMKGFTESLNVSVTAALFLYQLRKKIDELPTQLWRLKDEEIEELEALWYVKSLKRGEQILNELLERRG